MGVKGIRTATPPARYTMDALLGALHGGGEGGRGVRDGGGGVRGVGESGSHAIAPVCQKTYNLTGRA